MITRIFSCSAGFQPAVSPASSRQSVPQAPQAGSLHHNQRQAPGFTLIEILFSLVVLAIGLTSVLAIVLGSTRVSGMAAKRNVATIMISEAVADIEQRHLITGTQYRSSADQVGLLIETLNLKPLKFPHPNPNTHDGVSWNNLYGLTVGNNLPDLAPWNGYGGSEPYAPYLPSAGTLVNTLVWPLGTDPKYIGGPPTQARTSALQTSARQGGAAYRVIYRLERHPDWEPHTVDPTTGTVISYGPENPTSPYAGIYVLTLTVYADPTTNCTRLEQISDPVVVYLRDKKPR